MEILYVTPQAPSLDTGGGRHVYFNLASLARLGHEIHYVGLPFERTPELKEVRSICERTFIPTDYLHAVLTGNGSAVSGLLRQALAGRRKPYDLAFVEFSKTILPRGTARRHVVSFHNVQVDYSADDRLRRPFIRWAERKAWLESDLALVLHEFDRDRLEALYGPRRGRTVLHPVCAAEPGHRRLELEERRQHLLIAGSLDQPFNFNSIVKFLNEGWPRIADKGKELVIAGRNPPPLLRSLCQELRIRLIPSPSRAEMDALVANAALAIVPDVSGCGMKLRVAEAASLGVAVAGTTAALRGYSDIDTFGRSAATLPELAQAIGELVDAPAELKRLSEGAVKAWQTHYSLDAFSRRLSEVVTSLQHPSPETSPCASS